MAPARGFLQKLECGREALAESGCGWFAVLGRSWKGGARSPGGPRGWGAGDGVEGDAEGAEHLCRCSASPTAGHLELPRSPGSGAAGGELRVAGAGGWGLQGRGLQGRAFCPGARTADTALRCGSGHRAQVWLRGGGACGRARCCCCGPPCGSGSFPPAGQRQLSAVARRSWRRQENPRSADLCVCASISSTHLDLTFFFSEIGKLNS